jgi:hypothetical protein
VEHLVLLLPPEALELRLRLIIFSARQEYLSLSLGKLGLRVARLVVELIEPRQRRLFFLVVLGGLVVLVALVVA